MHIADPATGNLGANAIVGGGAGIATGAAFSSKYLGTKQVAVCFFGEGALGQGVLYEEMNLAQLWKLPVIYACENNLYNEYTHYSETTAGDILARPAAFGIAAEAVDGQDVRAVYAAAIGPRRAGAAGRRARVPAAQHLPLPRPSRGRHRARVLPAEAGGAALDVGARSDRAARRVAPRRRAWSDQADARPDPVGAGGGDGRGRGVCHQGTVSRSRTRWMRTCMPETAAQRCREITLRRGDPRGARRRDAPRPADRPARRGRRRGGHHRSRC